MEGTVCLHAKSSWQKSHNYYHHRFTSSFRNIARIRRFSRNTTPHCLITLLGRRCDMTCLRLFRHEPVTSPGNRVHISGVDRISVWGGRHLFLAPGRESGGEGGEREAGGISACWSRWVITGSPSDCHLHHPHLPLMLFRDLVIVNENSPLHTRGS